jgi:transposase
MMSKRIRYTEEFKRDAVSQVVGRGHSVGDVSKRLGVSTKSLYDWIKQYSKPETVLQEEDNLARENRRLKSELIRVTEERDILKKAAAYFAKESK